MAGRIRVLHVDDDPEFATLTARCLERSSDRVAVETVSSAEEGMDHIAAGEVDCVLSDYDMPGTDGVEFLRQVRAEDPHLPFVLFTGTDRVAVASEAIAAGVTDYVPKRADPDQFEVVADRIVAAVERARRQRERARLREAVERAADGLCILDRRGRLAYVSEGFADLHGYGTDALTGRHWQTVVAEEDRWFFWEEAFPAVGRDGCWSGVATGQRADGSTVRCEYAIVETGGGSLLCTVSETGGRREPLADA